MRFTILIPFFLLITYSSVSQSKSDTEEWILEKYYEYKYSEMPFNRLLFENDFLISTWMIEKDFGVVSKLKLKDITQIEVKLNSFPDKKKPMVYLNISCNEGKLLTKSIRPEGNTEWEISEAKGTMTNLSYDFIENKMSERFLKAFIHLVKLNGGIATVKKEPF